jgi:hypothetical protein
MTQAEDFFNNNFFAIACKESAIPNIAAATGLTSLCATHLHDRANWFFGAEVFVKGDDTMNFGNRDIKYIGKNRDQIFADISGVMLHSVQCWQHATFNVGELANDGFEFWERCVGSQGSQA